MFILQSLIWQQFAWLKCIVSTVSSCPLAGKQVLQTGITNRHFSHSMRTSCREYLWSLVPAQLHCRLAQQTKPHQTNNGWNLNFILQTIPDAKPGKGSGFGLSSNSQLLSLLSVEMTYKWLELAKAVSKTLFSEKTGCNATIKQTPRLPLSKYAYVL